jgi:hypothetical protein
MNFSARHNGVPSLAGKQKTQSEQDYYEDLILFVSASQPSRPKRRK